MSAFESNAPFPAFYDIYPEFKAADYDQQVSAAAYRAERDELALILGHASKKGE